jgi:hypothetical protein
VNDLIKEILSEKQLSSFHLKQLGYVVVAIPHHLHLKFWFPSLSRPPNIPHQNLCQRLTSQIGTLAKDEAENKAEYLRILAQQCSF